MSSPLHLDSQITDRSGSNAFENCDSEPLLKHSNADLNSTISDMPETEQEVNANGEGVMLLQNYERQMSNGSCQQFHLETRNEEYSAKSETCIVHVNVGHTEEFTEANTSEFDKNTERGSSVTIENDANSEIENDSQNTKTTNVSFGVYKLLNGEIKNRKWIIVLPCIVFVVAVIAVLGFLIWQNVYKRQRRRSRDRREKRKDVNNDSGKRLNTGHQSQQRYGMKEMFGSNMLLNISSLKVSSTTLDWLPDPRTPLDRTQIPCNSGHFYIPKNATYKLSSTITVFAEMEFGPKRKQKTAAFEYCIILKRRNNKKGWCQQPIILMGMKLPFMLSKTVTLQKGDLISVTMSNKDIVYNSKEYNTFNIIEVT